MFAFGIILIYAKRWAGENVCRADYTDDCDRIDRKQATKQNEKVQ